MFSLGQQFSATIPLFPVWRWLCCFWQWWSFFKFLITLKYVARACFTLRGSWILWRHRPLFVNVHRCLWTGWLCLGLGGVVMNGGILSLLQYWPKLKCGFCCCSSVFMDEGSDPRWLEITAFPVSKQQGCRHSANGHQGSAVSSKVSDVFVSSVSCFLANQKFVCWFVCFFIRCLLCWVLPQCWVSASVKAKSDQLWYQKLVVSGTIAGPAVVFQSMLYVPLLVLELREGGSLSCWIFCWVFCIFVVSECDWSTSGGTTVLHFTVSVWYIVY